MAQPIVVVDDDPSIRDVMAQVLGDDGYTVVLRATGDDVLDMLRRERPAALIIDLRLTASTSGLDVLATLEQDTGFRALPILVCSAAGDTLREQAPQLHARGYETLEKPFDIDDLLRWVRAHVPRASAPSG